MLRTGPNVLWDFNKLPAEMLLLLSSLGTRDLTNPWRWVSELSRAPSVIILPVATAVYFFVEAPRPLRLHGLMICRGGDVEDWAQRLLSVCGLSCSSVLSLLWFPPCDSNTKTFLYVQVTTGGLWDYRFTLPVMATASFFLLGSSWPLFP